MTGNATRTIYTLLMACNPLRAIVGDSVFSGVAVGIDPKEDACVVIHRTSSDHAHHLTGAAGLASVPFQLDLWGPTRDTVERMANAIREGIFKFRGPVDDMNVRDVVIDSMFDRNELPSQGEAIGKFGLIMQITIWHTESQPSLVAV